MLLDVFTVTSFGL